MEQQLEGLAKEGMGRLQDGAGGLVGDGQLQAKGKLNEIGGAVQRGLGEVQGQAKQMVDTTLGQAQDLYGKAEDFARAQPLATIGIALGLGFLAGFASRPRQRIYLRRW